MLMINVATISIGISGCEKSVQRVILRGSINKQSKKFGVKLCVKGMSIT